jgi:cysteinyl-tRNA synthetase|tara:strand:+ start:2748 stop:4115 length:1368 start_codon:yes stop_codon:yes gene_type:complete
MNIKLYNTLARKKQNFIPINSNRVTMYICGPTVYSYPHIGNARGPVIFDILAGLLKREYELIYVRNITDLDDKIYEAAKSEQSDVSEITERYTKIYHQDISALGVKDPDIEPRATDHIKEMIEMIESLLAKGYAYENEGHVLFSVDSYSDYGSLSNRQHEDQIAGSRVAIAAYKKNPRDFVLWKPSTPDLPGWESPWGVGRPGWHLECSTMAKKYLGDTLDIHGGGSDLIFPHHENECAQSICSHKGKPFANFWVHHGMIDFNNTKMSKSEGNLLLIRDLLKEIPGEVVRMALISTHYRKPINWSNDLIKDSKKKLDRLYGAIRKIDIFQNAEPSNEVLLALADDLNTPKALSALFNIVKLINNSEDPMERDKYASTLMASASLLGLMTLSADEWFKTTPNGVLTREEIEHLITQRERARKSKNFSESDRIRDDLLQKGVVIEDGPDGTEWRYQD